MYPSNVPADHTLAYALHAALHGNREDVILTAVNMNGDVDSVLAVALMPHEILTAAVNADFREPIKMMLD